MCYHFFRKELTRFIAENNLPVIGYLNSEVLYTCVMNMYMVQIDFVLRWHFVVAWCGCNAWKNCMLWDVKVHNLVEAQGH